MQNAEERNTRRDRTVRDSVAVIPDKRPHLLKRFLIPIFLIQNMKPSPCVANRVKTSVNANLPKLLALRRHLIKPFFEGDPSVGEPLHGFRVADAILSDDVMIEHVRNADDTTALSESFPTRRNILEIHSRRKSATVIEQIPSPKFVPCVMHEIALQG